jgi:hypothetical protein
MRRRVDTLCGVGLLAMLPAGLLLLLVGLVAVEVWFVLGPLASLRVDELAATLAHELAHYRNRDTRLAHVAYRGRRAFVGTVYALDQTVPFQRWLGRLLRRYLRVYLRASAGYLAADWTAGQRRRLPRRRGRRSWAGGRHDRTRSGADLPGHCR